jgi:NAD(P)-dependent dehydrogenase (short-subunit alcohol dehydrogenase family)
LLNKTVRGAPDVFVTANVLPEPVLTMTGRNGSPGDFAGVAVFLASRASDYVTGQTLYVDGGFSVT